MKRNISLNQIEERISNSPRGTIFLTSDFTDLASSDAANKALLRLEEAGMIRRIIFGIYEYPEYNEFLNEPIEPAPDKVAHALARKFGWTIVPCGDTALNMLGLSTQVPAVWLYVSDGTYKDYTYGNTTIKFKKIANKEISKLSYKTALVIQALKALGKSNVNEEVIYKISGILSQEEKATMLAEAKNATAWVYEYIKQICKSELRGWGYSKDKLNKWDILVSISSGALTSMIDVFMIDNISLRDAHKWGEKEVNAFVIKTANSKGYKGNNLGDAVKHLEDMYPISADKLTNDFGGGAYHHLRDFSHHPTIVGLLFSIASQFTGNGYGTDRSGKFKPIPIPGWKRPDLFTAIYNGTVTWLLHMISDIAGSSSTIKMGKEGTGLPGPMMSFLKEVSSLAPIRALTGANKDGDNKFSVVCSKLFRGTLLGDHDENGHIVKGGELRFDFRTELGIGHGALTHKQHIPVIINEVIVCSFYSVLRLCDELKQKEISTVEDLKKLDFKAFLPWNSAALRHMRTIATTTFSAVDITVALTKAKVKNKGNVNGLALDFLQGINYIGLGHLTLALSGEGAGAIKWLSEKTIEFTEAQKIKLYSSVPDADEALELLKKAGATAGAVLHAGTPIGFISAAIGVYGEIATAMKELDIAHQERLLIEEQCRINIEIIKENQSEMELVVNQYMFNYLSGFGKALDTMNEALVEGDSEKYLQGNATIQNQLGRQAEFETQNEFDDLMASDKPLKL